MIILAFLKLLGCLGLLMYGMKMLGESLQKMAGSQLRRILDTLTTNRFTSILSGALITAVIQSASATSVMTIGFVHAGMLSFIQGLSIIMGASIGNTLIAWLMAAEFNFAISCYIFAFFCIAIWLVNTRRFRSLGESLFGICFMFLGLRLLCEFADNMELNQNVALTGFFGTFQENYGSYLVLLLLGALLTFLIQSSAALMAAGMILCSTGLLSIPLGIALILGENLGRAIITCKSAYTAQLTARRVATAQLIFNLSGIAWVLALLPFIANGFSRGIAMLFGLAMSDHHLPSYILAAFHTSFNFLNVVLFIGLIKPLERLSNVLIPACPDDEDESELRYITGGLLATPELSVLEAQKEVTNYADLTQRMFTQVCSLLTINKNQEFQDVYLKIKKMETTSDELEEEIADYLGEVDNDLLSAVTKNQIRCMIREVSELESVADSCYIISRIIGHKYRGKEQFSEKQQHHLHQLFLLVSQALDEIKRISSLKRPLAEGRTILFINQEIKNFKKQLRSQNAIDINNHEYSYHLGTLYLDIINECEKIGEYTQNIIEAKIESAGQAN